MSDENPGGGSGYYRRQREQWEQRRDAAQMRSTVFARDQGICTLCQLDTMELKREYEAQGSSWAMITWLDQKGYPYHRTTFWDMDHVIPISEGGSPNDLANLRTLCIPCHREQSAALAKRLAAKRAAEHAAGKPRMRTMRWPG